MKYESAKTAKGNIGVSWESQEAADMQAAEMDRNGNTNCYNCSGCSGVLKWKGGEAKRLIALNGLYWPVSISKTHIQIGCQNHSIERWEGFTDAQIAAMDSEALEFWKQNKALIMTVAKGVNHER